MMTVSLLLAAAAVFVAVFVGVSAAASWMLARNAPERQRLRALTGPDVGGLLIESSLTTKPDPALARLSRWLPKNPKELSQLQRRLTRAGYRRPSAAVYFVLTQVSAAVACFAAAVLILGFNTGMVAGLMLAVVGYLTPNLWLRRATTQREKAIRNALPDGLDLMTVCVEAGSGIDQAITRASKELGLSHPVLADELQLITTEVRAGKPRLEAFKNFASRTGVSDVKSLVSMLVQTDRFGTSIADALRVHSDTSRTKRRQAAEERAGKVGVKLVFPLVLCLFPALYVVCFGPVVIEIFHAFFE
jgi:tight adherence protein C